MNLPPELTIPGENGIKELYSSMKVRATSYDSKVIFELKTPLFSNKRFQLFRLIPIPTPVNGSFMSIQPSTEYLIINLQRDLYYPLEEIELLRCKKQQDYFTCQMKHPLFKPASGKCICELNLLKHQGIKECQIHKQTLTPLWAQLTATNKWIYTTTTPTTIDIICGQDIFSQHLVGSGEIQFFDRCRIERDDMLIQTTKTVSTQINSAFIPTFNLREIINKTSTLQLTKFQYKQHAHLEELETSIQNLQRDIDNPPINHHDIHNYCINYGSIIFSIIVGATLYHLYKKHKSALPRLPIPKPRASTVEAAEC